jgi:hypothetical protein
MGGGDTEVWDRQRIGERINEYGRRTADGGRQKWTMDGGLWTVAGQAFQPARADPVPRVYAIIPSWKAICAKQLPFTWKPPGKQNHPLNSSAPEVWDRQRIGERINEYGRRTADRGRRDRPQTASMGPSTNRGTNKRMETPSGGASGLLGESRQRRRERAFVYSLKIR